MTVKELLELYKLMKTAEEENIGESTNENENVDDVVEDLADIIEGEEDYDVEEVLDVVDELEKTAEALELAADMLMEKVAAQTKRRSTLNKLLPWIIAGGAGSAVAAPKSRKAIINLLKKLVSKTKNVVKKK